MTTLRPAPVSYKQLNYDAHTRAFLGEMSDTNGFARVYDDACDVGLTIVGKERAVVFAVWDEQRDAEGDVMWWDLKPVDRSVGVTLRLLND